MSLPRLYAIVDHEVARAHGLTVMSLAQVCLDAGARLVQLRAKPLGSGDLLRQVDDLTGAAAAIGASLIVNDRADVARLAGVGVHVGQDDLPPAMARQVVGPTAIVGFSTHTTAQVDAAVLEPVNYVAVGPVFVTRTKETGYEAVGLDLVRYAAAAAAEQSARAGRPALPIVAIGGITLDNAPSVLAAGASSVAVISDLLVTGSPADRIRQYLDRLL